MMRVFKLYTMAVFSISLQSAILLMGTVIFISPLISSCEEIVTDPSAETAIYKKYGDAVVIVTPGNDTKHSINKRNVVKNRQNIWTDKVIPYDIANVFSEAEKRLILKSMQHWENNTCIRFRLRMPGDQYFAVFISGERRQCQSFVGRIDQSFQPQGIALGSGCLDFPVIVHEIGHTIGFFHEHIRHDRDEHVRVVDGNISPGAESAFTKLEEGEADTLGFGYDHASIMHYGPTTFSKNGSSTLVSVQPDIPIGNAKELSPLDIAKANALYNCGPHDSHPPPSVVVPAELPLTLPPGIGCGSVINFGATRGTITPPQFSNQECAYVLRTAEGYGIQISFPVIQLDSSSDCSRDYLQMYSGSSLGSSNIIRYDEYFEGRICNSDDSRFQFYSSNNVIVVYYRTGNSSTTRLITITYSRRDNDECQDNSRCHSCNNLEGSFECTCNPGYYHSFSATTCYDVNECAVNNGGCSDTCTNLGGSYRCGCRSGFLQEDGFSCGPSPSSPPTNIPGTIIDPRMTAATTPTMALPPPTTSPTTPPPTTSSTTPPTTQPTTPPTTLPTTLPTPVSCGGTLTGASGVFNTPNWPLTYPLNFECQWNIILPDSNSFVRISFDDDFGIAGQLPACDRDQLILFDGSSTQSSSLGVFCHLTRPEPISSTTNRLTVVFKAADVHGPTRHGFRATYTSVSIPSTPPPTTMAPTTRATTMATTHPTTMALTTRATSMATTQATTMAPTTRATIDGATTMETTQATTMSPTTRSATMETTQAITMSPTTRATTMATTQATTMAPTTTRATTIESTTTHTTSMPPTTIATTQSPVILPLECGGGSSVLTSTTGSIQTVGWPYTVLYPLDIECQWNIVCPSNNRVRITFESNFRIAGRMPACDKGELRIESITPDNVALHGRFCHKTAPENITTDSNEVKVSFISLSRGRNVFRLNYECLVLYSPCFHVPIILFLF